jgi:anionic cell wall polymer biosynthesis LytR-Cps2A-Psr (LCP) family protein
LNGSQALAYSRIRNLDEDGDFSRTNRQRNILTALVKRCANASAAEMIQLFRKAAPMVSTDIRKSQFLVMIRELTPLLSQPKMISQRIPTEGTYCHRIIDGMAVLDADLEAARRILQSSLMGK